MSKNRPDEPQYLLVLSYNGEREWHHGGLSLEDARRLGAAASAKDVVCRAEIYLADETLPREIVRGCRLCQGLGEMHNKEAQLEECYVCHGTGRV